VQHVSVRGDLVPLLQITMRDEDEMSDVEYEVRARVRALVTDLRHSFSAILVDSSEISV
jgi:hypothetical protein